MLTIINVEEILEKVRALRVPTENENGYDEAIEGYNEAIDMAVIVIAYYIAKEHSQ